MPAYNFQRQFAPDVKAGRKRQTIRRKRKRRTRIGETLYLYVDQRSKRCRLLRAAICRDLLDIEIRIGGILLDGQMMMIGSPHADQFARADGFPSSGEMIEWFKARYGLPFRHGVVIRW